MGMQNDRATLKDSLAIFYYKLQPSGSYVFAKLIWKLNVHTNLQVNVDSNFIHNCQKKNVNKQPRFPSINERLNKPCYIHTMEYLINNQVVKRHREISSRYC